MNFYRRRFNLYLLPLAAGLLLSGCALWPHHDKDRGVGIVRIHVESDSKAAGATQNINLLRSQPVTVNIATTPILTEADIIGAEMFDTGGGGFAVQLRFEETAGWRLQQYTAASPGKHLAIFGQWDKTPADGRWLAAPIISRPIATGTLLFTPDTSRKEAALWVEHLNYGAKKKGGLKSDQ
jgi:preprotein translocase subunit SecD